SFRFLVIPTTFSTASTLSDRNLISLRHVPNTSLMPSTIPLNILSISSLVIPVTVVVTSERTCEGTSSLASTSAPSLTSLQASSRASLRAFFKGLGQSSFTTTICFFDGLTTTGFVFTRVPVGSQQSMVHFHGL